ncbi:MAG: HU family DNA-binding protein [Acidimicrobiales bacterium]
MNRRELIRAVAAQTDQDVKEVESVVAGLTDVITAVVAKGEPVVIQGFVKFTKVSRAARIGRNPQTGEPVKIKAKTVAKATAMKAFRDTVMAPSSAPRLARGVWPTSPELLAKQAEVRKEAAKPVAAKAPLRKSAAKKAPAKKAASRQPVKKAPARQTVAKKAPTRRAPSRR